MFNFRLKRLANQAQKMVERGVMGVVSLTTAEQRSALIRSYGNLYAQSRIETLECLDKLEGLRDADELKSKLLFSVVVVSFLVFFVCFFNYFVPAFINEYRDAVSVPFASSYFGSDEGTCEKNPANPTQSNGHECRFNNKQQQQHKYYNNFARYDHRNSYTTTSSSFGPFGNGQTALASSSTC